MICVEDERMSFSMADTVYTSPRYAFRSAVGIEKPNVVEKTVAPRLAIAEASSIVAALIVNAFGCVPGFSNLDND